MLSRIVMAVVVGVVVALGCILLGSLLASIDVTIAAVIGTFLKQYGSVLGILAAIWFFFSGRTTTPLI